MKTFRVNLRRTVVQFASVIVLAEDDREAAVMARHMGLANEVWWAEDDGGSGGAVDAIDVEDVEG